MKHFFYVLFGGISAVALGILISIAGKSAIEKVAPAIAAMTTPISSKDLAASSPQLNEETSVIGLKRYVNYTASVEESLMRAATLSLPSGTVKDIGSKSYLLKNLDEGITVAQFDTDRLLPIASLTKLITAVVADRFMDDNDKVKISKDLIATYGNNAKFKNGEILQVKDLFYPMLMVSSNSAAEALARAYGREKFIKEMNDFVQSIGAYRTSFVDPSGLSPDNRSTANDLVIIMDWINKNNSSIIEITKLKTKTIKNHTWTNPTKFLSWSNYSGGKNGFTDEARNTSVSLFTMGKSKDLYAVVVLGTKTRDADIVKLLNRVR